MPELESIQKSAVAELLEEQRRRWQQGDRVPAEHYLQRTPPLAESAALDLIVNEVLLRQEAGETPSAKEYIARFPQYAAALEGQFALQQADGKLWLGDIETLAQVRGPRPDMRETMSPAHPHDPSWLAMPAGVPGYEVLDLLGRGGMGVVYKARQVALERTVALKMVLAGAHASADERSRFQSEAKSVAQLQHPNIVQVYDYGVHDGLPWFSLEFVAGGTLAQKRAGKALPPAEAARLLLTLARAVAAAHQSGVIHRDLKPANILLMPDGTPKITDFGLARRLDDQNTPTQSGALMGTPSYMAPEQARGRAKEAGPPADIYALGAILYDLLTGQPPFREENPLDTLLKVVNTAPPPPRQLNPAIPPALEAVCLKCLAKKPGDRYASATALADELERYLQGASVQAPPPARTRHPLRWVAAACVLIMLAAAAMLLPRSARTSPNEDNAAVNVEGAAVVPPDAPSNSLPALEGTLILRVFDSKGTKKGILGRNEGLLPLHNGDQLHVEARLNQPAYAYILWIDADGKTELLYPSPDRDHDRWPAVLQPSLEHHSPALTDGQVKDAWPLEGNKGLETILLLARRTPMAADELAELLKPRYVVARNASPALCQDLDLAPPQAGFDGERKRGPAKTTGKVEDPFGPLRTAVAPHADTIRAWSFAHE